MPSIGDLENITWEELNKMTRQQLAKIAQPLFDAANKRLKRLAATPGGTSSPAYTSKFSTKGKNRAELANEVARVKNFLGHKTSSVSGFKKWRKETEDRYGLTFESEKARVDFWAAFHIIQSSRIDIIKMYGSERVLSTCFTVSKLHPEYVTEEVAQATIDYFDGLYEEMENAFYEDDFEDLDDEDIPDYVDDVFRG